MVFNALYDTVRRVNSEADVIDREIWRTGRGRRPRDRAIASRIILARRPSGSYRPSRRWTSSDADDSHGSTL